MAGLFILGHSFLSVDRRHPFLGHWGCLRTGDCDDDVKQAIANKIIELAKNGERNPDLLCEHALEDIREPQV